MDNDEFNPNFVYVRSKILEFDKPIPNGEVFTRDSVMEARLIGLPVFHGDEISDITKAIGMVYDSHIGEQSLEAIIAVDKTIHPEIMEKIHNGEAMTSFCILKSGEEPVERGNYAFTSLSIITNKGFDCPGMVIQVVQPPLPIKTNRLEMIE